MKFKKLLATAASAALVALALPAAAIADEGGTSLSDGDVLPEVDATIHFSQARYFDLEGAGSNLDVTVPMLATVVNPSGDGVTISENNGELTFTAEDGVPDNWHAVRLHAGFARFTHVGTFDVETSGDAYRAIKIFDAEDRDGEPLFAVVERADLGSDEGWGLYRYGEGGGWVEGFEATNITEPDDRSALQAELEESTGQALWWLTFDVGIGMGYGTTGTVQDIDIRLQPGIGNSVFNGPIAYQFAQTGTSSLNRLDLYIEETHLPGGSQSGDVLLYRDPETGGIGFWTAGDPVGGWVSVAFDVDVQELMSATDFSATFSDLDGTNGLYRALKVRMMGTGGGTYAVVEQLKENDYVRDTATWGVMGPDGDWIGDPHDNIEDAIQALIHVTQHLSPASPAYFHIGVGRGAGMSGIVSQPKITFGDDNGDHGGGTDPDDVGVLPEFDATIHFSGSQYNQGGGSGFRSDLTIPMLATLVDPGDGDNVTITEDDGKITFEANGGAPDGWHAVRVHGGFAPVSEIRMFEADTSGDAYRAVKIFDAEDRDGEPLFAVVERADLGSDEGWGLYQYGEGGSAGGWVEGFESKNITNTTDRSALQEKLEDLTNFEDDGDGDAAWWLTFDVGIGMGSGTTGTVENIRVRLLPLNGESAFQGPLEHSVAVVGTGWSALYPHLEDTHHADGSAEGEVRLYRDPVTGGIGFWTAGDPVGGWASVNFHTIIGRLEDVADFQASFSSLDGKNGLYRAIKVHTDEGSKEYAVVEQLKESDYQRDEARWGVMTPDGWFGETHENIKDAIASLIDAIGAQERSPFIHFHIGVGHGAGLSGIVSQAALTIEDDDDNGDDDNGDDGSNGSSGSNGSTGSGGSGGSGGSSTSPVASIVGTAGDGGSVTNDAGASGPTGDVPLTVTVTTPSAGEVSIDIDGSGDSDSERFGVGAEIDAPDASSGDPLLLRFNVHPSRVPDGLDLSELLVLRDGYPVPACLYDGLAVPDPCVVSAELAGSGNLVVEVATSTASDWTFASSSTACPDGLVLDGGFTDASATHDAAIDCAAWWGVIGGYPNGAFGVGDTLSRGQGASLIARLLQTAGVTLPSASGMFADVDGTTHADAINGLAGLGLVNGVTTTRFAPGDPLTRAQTTALIVRAYEHVLDELPKGSSTFTDIVGTTHEEAITKAAAAGLVRGVIPSRFDPGSDLPREQAASLLTRLLDRYYTELGFTVR